MILVEAPRYFSISFLVPTARIFSPLMASASADGCCGFTV